MSAALTREQIRIRIDLLEALQCVIGAIDDVSVFEFDPDERRFIGVDMQTDNGNTVAFVHYMPPEVVLAGLQAMRTKLEELTK